MPSTHRPSSAPSSAPSSPSSPKQVNFAGKTGVTDVLRAASTKEHWTFYEFERHAAECRSCADPYARYKAGKRLCRDGNMFAADVDTYIYCKEGKVYSRVRDNGQKVRVEIPSGYDRTSSLLKAIERGSKSRHPFLSAEKPKEQPASPRDQAPVSPRGHHSPNLERVVPVMASPRVHHSPTMERVVPVPVSRRYSTTLPARQPVQPPQPYAYPESLDWRYPYAQRPFYEADEGASTRGSLYETDIALMQERERREAAIAYNLEVREPARHISSGSRHHRPHRHSGIFW
ncbi:hypothetical protein NA57DRAFT_77018 [Rhizodiscina lignyota]|uniref:Uncharacterized protein n=1 Tax=Rhizodiscina lignyota TaxID=1504668 RepID=A0A9P4IAF5_9PEZI|nr:hypothetical protein NA57DRAFT_77018 [Rhizodiscina lignyota]